MLTTGPTLSLSGGTGLSTSGNRNAGSWTINLAGAVDNNSYTINYMTGTLTIAQKTLNVGLTGSVSKTYNANTTATLISANYTNNAISGDIVGVTNTSGIYDNANAGTRNTVTDNGVTIRGADSGNYVLASSSASGAVGAIDPKAITVTADNKTMNAGSAVPPLTYTYYGLAGGDSSAGFSGALSRTGSGNAGTYSILRNTLAATGNYIIGIFNPGIFTITGNATPVIPSTVSALPQSTSFYSFTSSIPLQPQDNGIMCYGGGGNLLGSSSGLCKPAGDEFKGLQFETPEFKGADTGYDSELGARRRSRRPEEGASSLPDNNAPLS